MNCTNSKCSTGPSLSLPLSYSSVSPCISASHSPHFLALPVPPWSEAGLGLCPGQQAILIRHTAVERYRSEEKTALWANAQQMKVEGKEKEREGGTQKEID